MKKLLLLTALLLPLLSFSQRLHLNLFGGIANYQGDLQDKYLTLDQSNGAFGAGLQYDLTGHFSVRTGLVYAAVGGDDKRNKETLQPRNLNFRSRILEGNLLVQYDIFDIQKNSITPYIFGGVGMYHFDPFTRDTLGNKIFLQPLGTEGQGLAEYPDRKPYKLTQFNIPFGGGIKFRISENMVLGYEVGIRKLFTDYLDDVSAQYPDEIALATARGPKAVEMSYRGGELKNGDPVFPSGKIRGGPKQKDWYYLQGITLSIGLRSNKFMGVRGRGRTDCPPNVL